jgi:FtsH-binding integral membrane protein
MTTKTKGNTMKKIYEYITMTLFVIGLFSLIGAVGAVEANQFLLGGAMALLGIATSILGLYSQEMEKEIK